MGATMSYQPLTANGAYKLASQEGDWMVAFMQFVDDFRRTPSFDLIKDVPETNIDSNEKWLALLKAIVNELCRESGLEEPSWSAPHHWLSKPWFVSGMKSLYASAIQEVPLNFKRNNIFVMGNFLNRC